MIRIAYPVGVTMRARGILRGPSISLLRMGRMNAAVLPVPVCAVPITSRPRIAAGMAASWIGVAVSYPARLIPFIRRESRLNCSKFKIVPVLQKSIVCFSGELSAVRAQKRKQRWTADIDYTIG